MNSPARSVTRALIQAKDGVPSDEAFFKAFDGFRKRGVPCELFDPAQLADGTLALSRTTLVAGAIRVVEQALASLGVIVPPADNLPERLASYRGRKVWRSTWGELRSRFGRTGPLEPLFVKPLRRNKGFPSVALYNADDLRQSPHADADEVLVQEYVLFATEWRCFVCRGQILNLSHYQGDPLVFPDAAVIRRAIADFGPSAPAGCGIDFGVLSNGRTVLVEVNEGYSLGSYGLNAVEYAELLEARWLELVSHSE